jgi:hypothetical protein
MNDAAPASLAADRLALAWRGPLPESERLLLMRLSREKQELALARIEGMNRFEDGTAASAIYPELGIGKARFYKLARAWKSEKSVASLVPFATEESRAKPSRLKAPVIALIKQCVEESATAREAVSEHVLITRIRERAKAASLPVPASETLSRYLAKAAMDDTHVALAPVARGTGVNPGDIFGAHIVIDHTTVDLVVHVDGKLLKPTLSIVLDDASRVILGACMTARHPDPDGVVFALLDARARYKRLVGKGVHALAGLRPLITARFPATERWSQLDWQLQNAGFRAWNVSRPASEHHRGYGRLIRRFMITKLADIGLLTTPTWQEPAARVSKEEAVKYVPLTWEDARAVVDEAIGQHNRSRIETAIELSTISPDALKSSRIERSKRDYLAYCLSSFAGNLPPDRFVAVSGPRRPRR